MELLQQTYFSDILHWIAQALLLPAVILLIALVAYSLWCIGSVLIEWGSERRHFKVTMPGFLDSIDAASTDELPAVIADSGLLGSQKRVLLTVWDHRNLPVDSHIALAKRLIEEREDWHMRVLQRTQTVSKIAPMLGLMGTLIPLGPGLISLSQNDPLALSASLLVAFDTTVAGLVVAVVTYVITKIRQRWYDNYMSALEAASTAVLEKVDGLRTAGELNLTGPTNCLERYLEHKDKGEAEVEDGNEGRLEDSRVAEQINDSMQIRESGGALVSSAPNIRHATAQKMPNSQQHGPTAESGYTERSASCAALSGIAVASLVIAIIAAATSFLPVINNASFVLALIGFVLAIGGLIVTKANNKRGRGIAIAGLILSVLAVVIVLLTQAYFVEQLNELTSGAKPVSSEIEESEESNSTEAPKPSEASSKQVDYSNMKIGDSVTLENGLRITLTNAELYTTEYSEKQVTRVHVTYENAGNEKQSFNHYDWTAENANGVETSAVIPIGPDDYLKSGDLKPGGTVSGYVYFDDSSISKVYYYTNVLLQSDSEIAWAIGKG